jgi:hypothetical protein
MAANILVQIPVSDSLALSAPSARFKISMVQNMKEGVQIVQPLCSVQVVIGSTSAVKMD